MTFKMDFTDSLKTAIRGNISYIFIYKIHIQLISINLLSIFFNIENT
jgi:hypothetical protein